MPLHNIYDREVLKRKLVEENFKRVTLSFYRYVIIGDPESMRNELYAEWDRLEVKGRIYIAREGINAQLSVPEHHFEAFRQTLDSRNEFEGLRLNIAIEDDGKSFYKLIVKVRKKIVADGLEDDTFDVTNVGTHLDAASFNAAMDDPNAVIVDLRNHYESEIGHFENAICPDADTFKQELPMVLDMLKDQKDKKLLLYCTGGIRCEKASAYFRHHGFSDVSQLQGGIIHYARQVQLQGLASRFIGKNFVFDNRMGERIGDEIISKCHQCGALCDTHVNCANDDCHLLFLQCEKCREEMQGCCTPQCRDIAAMPVEEQRKLRKGKDKREAHAVYKSRLRPNLARFLDRS